MQKALNGEKARFSAPWGKTKAKDSSIEWSNGIFSQNRFLKRHFLDRGKEYPAPSFVEHFF